MILISLPFSALGYFIDQNLYDFYFIELGFKISSLFFDYFLLQSLYFITKEKTRRLLITIFWLSPITIYCTYIYGAIDIIPISDNKFKAILPSGDEKIYLVDSGDVIEISNSNES